MPIRLVGLLIVIPVLSAVALLRPQIGIYSYVWFALMRPDALAWSIGRFPLSFALAVCTLAGALRHLGRIRVLFHNPFTRLLLLLQIPIALSVVFYVGERYLAADRYEEYLRTIVMVLLIPVLIRTEAELRWLLLVVAWSMGLLGMKFGFYGIWEGGVHIARAYSPQHDNNTLGLAAAMTVPLCWCLRALVSSRWARIAMQAMVLGCVSTLIMTNSRGATLSAVAAFLCLVRRSRRKFWTLVLLVVFAAWPIYLVKDQYLDRLATLPRFEEEGSAASRIYYARAAFKMWMDYPILGVGFGGRNYSAMTAPYLGWTTRHGAHNSYLQMLVDSGIFALLLYGGLLFGSIRWLGRSAGKMRELRPDLECIPIALQTALITFAVGATFGSSQRYDFSYILLMCASAWHTVQRGLEEELRFPQPAATAEGIVPSPDRPAAPALGGFDTATAQLSRVGR